MVNASKIAKELLLQKYRYWANTLSEDAIGENFFNIYSTIDLLGFSFDITILDSVFSSILIGLSFGIPFTQIPPFNTCFNVELPSPEDFVKGKLLDIEPVSCLDKYPEIGEWLTDLSLYLSTHFSPQVAETTHVKGVYGVTRYGYSYYDPAEYRELLRSTLIKEAKRYTGTRTTAIIYTALSKSLNIPIELLDYIFTLFKAIERAKIEAAMSEYSWSDYTIAQEEKPGSIEFKTYDLAMREITLLGDSMTDLWGGAYSDIAISDISVVTDGEVPLVEQFPLEPRRAEVAIGEAISTEAKSRLEYTPLLVANYQTVEERADFTKSQRADTYGVSRAIYYRLKEIVDRELKDTPSFIRNQYNVAVQQLYSRLTRIGGWGSEAYRAMDLDTLKATWIEEWSSKGLEREVLESLFSKAYRAVKTYAPIRLASKIKLMARYMG